MHRALPRCWLHLTMMLETGSALHVLQMKQWHYFHMACMKSMPDLLARKGAKMQQLMAFYSQRRTYMQFKDFG